VNAASLAAVHNRTVVTGSEEAATPIEGRGVNAQSGGNW